MTTKHAEGNTFFAALFLSQWVSPTFKIDLSDDPDAVAVMSLNSVISMVPAVLKIDKFINISLRFGAALLLAKCSLFQHLTTCVLWSIHGSSWIYWFLHTEQSSSFSKKWAPRLATLWTASSNPHRPKVSLEFELCKKAWSCKCTRYCTWSSKQQV